MQSRKLKILNAAQERADGRAHWIEKHKYFFQEDWRYLRYLVPEGKRVLDLGCGTGALLNALRPSEGVGIDFSARMIEQGKTQFPHLIFLCGDAERLEAVHGLDGTFDVIILSDTVGVLDDCLLAFKSLHRFCRPETRVIVTYHSLLWGPLSMLYTRLMTRQASIPQNWLSSADIGNMLELADFEVIKRDWRLLSPFWLLGLGRLINRFIATLPCVRQCCLRTYVIARPRPRATPHYRSVSVVVPCRNERGNIEAAVRRLPRLADDMEIIFVEGGSSDGTWGEIERVRATYAALDIKAFKQSGQGKGDAVRLGLSRARGDVLMILDGDLTMPPEELTKYYDALHSGKGEFINGSRLVYPIERQAMRLLNQIANQIFALLFTYLLNQRYTDTLCGTKVLRRSDYHEIERNRCYFGNFDPFGDFDLLFGASKLNLKTAEVPIRYRAREYGETQISRFRHGWLLLRMAWFAFLRMKAL